MAYNLERIKAEITDICENAGFRGVKYLNISINPRLSTTLGRVKYRANPIYPYAIEFSKNFIENNTDEDIHEVIMHECAHAIVTVRTKEKHGHDKYFKAVCAELGTTNDKMYFNSDNKEPQEQVYKYQIYCKDCGKLVASYKRKGKVIKNLSFYKCSLCGGELKMVKRGE